MKRIQYQNCSSKIILSTNLPTARQYKVLFLPSTAISMAAGMSLHAGALGVCESV